MNRSPHVTKKLLRKNGRGPALAGMPVYYIDDHNIYIVKNMCIRGAYGSGVVRSKMSYIPRSASLLLLLARVFVLSNIDEVV